MIKLYGNPLSGNSHRVSALLSILNVDYENYVVDLKSGEHKTTDYLKLNPLGQIPVLTDGDLVLRDSTAILMYLARKFDTDNRWLPTDAAGLASVQQWLSTAVHEIQSGPFVLRVIKVFGSQLDGKAAEEKTRNLFGHLFEPHLAENDWLVRDHATLADIACYSYIARVTEGDFSLEPYPAILSWLTRIEAIEGFAPMMKVSDL